MYSHGGKNEKKIEEHRGYKVKSERLFPSVPSPQPPVPGVLLIFLMLLDLLCTD